MSGDERPLVIAHRGASAVRPENTLPAFEMAASLGADGVELDVRRTADGVLVVHHDTHDADGRLVSALDRSALDPDVPNLTRALEVCTALGLWVNVEIKSWPDDADFDAAYRSTLETVALVQGLGGAEQFLVSSFDAECVRRVHALAPELPTALLTLDIDGAGRTVDEVAAAGHVALNPWDPTVDAPLLAAAHGAGLRVYPWTVDDPDRMRELCRLGVDGIITNVPDLARAVVDGR
ncbi:MAG: glycerophosphodiester phosphodiesterase [Acidimicrobiales bacterium]|nr:glycerophosphodiester phosphodiesterase [Acidimicrobiales bacterium]